MKEREKSNLNKNLIDSLQKLSSTVNKVEIETWATELENAYNALNEIEEKIMQTPSSSYEELPSFEEQNVSLLELKTLENTIKNRIITTLSKLAEKLANYWMRAERLLFSTASPTPVTTNNSFIIDVPKKEEIKTPATPRLRK